MTHGPYAEAAWLYREAGWAGVVPLPRGEKGPPPRGYTGWAGVEPSGADIQAWIEGSGRHSGAGNIGLRIPHGVYGLDVDAYGEKDGAAALAELEAAYGPLPATWVITSRDDSVSGIRLFRAAVPPGRRWRDEPAGHGRGIEAIHYGHRYAVTWPSVHPDTGRKYMIWPQGGMAGVVGVEDVVIPRLEDLPELPGDWVLGLSQDGEVLEGESASHEQTLAVVTAFLEGAACDRVRDAASRGLARLREARDGAALHPAGRDATHELARLGHEGHVGARRALAEHYGAFTEVREARGLDRRSAEAEWWRLVRGAVGKLAGERRDSCDCALLAGEGLDAGDLYMETAAERASALGGEGGTGGLDAIAATPGVPAHIALRDEMLSSSQMIDRPPPVPLVRGLLYMDTLAWLIGKSGSFKSFIALDVAQHVGLGRPWAGRRTRQGRVIYIAAEGSGGMTLRVRAWRDTHGEPNDEAVKFLPRPVQANNPEWSTLIATAAEMMPSLVVVDTQARVTVGIKENDNTEMGQFIEQVDRLRRATGACVLLVHHIGRNGEDARGASAMDGAQDTELKVERVGGAHAMTARLVTDKQKDGPDTESVDFEMKTVELGEDPETGDTLTSLVVNTTVFIDPAPRPWEQDIPDKLGRILEVLWGQFSESGATGSQVLSVLKERGWSQDYPRTSFYRAWNELQRLDKIHRIKGSQRWTAVEGDDE